MKPEIIALGAISRRFATLAVAAIIAEISGHGLEWLRQALASDPKTAVWIPALWMGIEFVQKLWRECKKIPETVEVMQ